jgi:diguanylate cyclase (GGDEF)-like protein
MRFNIALKLGCLMALFGILPTGLAGYYSYTSSRDILLKAAERDLLTSVQVLGRNLHGNLDDIGLDAQLLANGPEVRELPGASSQSVRLHAQDNLAELFRAMLQVHPDYMQIRLISAVDHGLELVRVDRDGERLLRVSGADLQEKAHYAYVFDTLRLAPGETRLSPIVINHEQGAHSGLGKPTLHVSTPVADASGKVFALLVINVDLDQLFNQLQGDLPAQYQVYLSNRWGDLLVHPDHQRTFGFDQGRRLFIQDEFPEVARLLGEKHKDHLISRSVAQEQQDGLVAAFVRISNNAQTSEPFIVLGLGQSQSLVLAEASRVGQKIVQIVLLFSLLALLTAIITSRAVIRPLKSMTQAVQLFSRERKISELPSRHDELGQLAQSFREMQEEILSQLEDLTHSRTAFEHLSRHDPLTGLPNRRVFFDRLERALINSQSSGKHLAVLFVDLDHFKSINDRYGHSLGDHVLKAVANLLRSATCENDSVARLGGDEFVIFFEAVEDAQHIVTILEKLHNRFQLPLFIDGHEVRVNASMGVSMFPRDGNDIEALVQHADHAMYAAKKSGRNTYSFDLSDAGENRCESPS